MKLVQVTKDATMLVSGYEHHSWNCSGCGEAERRMVFTRESTPVENIVCKTSRPDRIEPYRGHNATNGAWAKAIERLRERQGALKARAEAAKEAVKQAEWRAQFNSDWEKPVNDGLGARDAR
jgi:hypothetical protein